MIKDGSEEKESLSPPWASRLANFRNVRQLLPFERRLGIFLKQSASFLFAKLIGHLLVRGPQPRRPDPAMVRVAGHEMHHPLANPPERDLLGGQPESSGERTPGHLNKAAAPHPLPQTLCVRSQNDVTFRVRNDQPQPGKLHVVQGLIHRRRNRDFIEFHQQVIPLVDAVLPGLPAQRG